MTFAAILSASRPSGDPSASPRAGLVFAGQTLVEYQARQAARAGADRILILVGVVTPALSQAVDRLSADGIPVGLVRDMVSMLRDAPRDSDVLLVADGAAIAQQHFQAMAQTDGNALLVVDDSRASAPFERIDAGQRWAGLARVSPELLFGTLDMVGDWNRVYGSGGFLQYQFVVPFEAVDTLRTIIDVVVASGYASFVNVLKRMGHQNAAMLSFPTPGWTLTIDLPAAPPPVRTLVERLDELVLGVGGRLYLAKDATTTPANLRAGYPRLDEWLEVRHRVDPHGVFVSDQARRLGLV